MMTKYQIGDIIHNLFLKEYCLIMDIGRDGVFDVPSYLVYSMLDDKNKYYIIGQADTNPQIIKVA